MVILNVIDFLYGYFLVKIKANLHLNGRVCEIIRHKVEFMIIK